VIKYAPSNCFITRYDRCIVSMKFSASEVTTLWRYTNLFIIIIIIIIITRFRAAVSVLVGPCCTAVLNCIDVNVHTVVLLGK